MGTLTLSSTCQNPAECASGVCTAKKCTKQPCEDWTGSKDALLDKTPCKDWIGDFKCTAEALKQHDFTTYKKGENGYTKYFYSLADMMKLRVDCPVTCGNCNGCTAGKPPCGTGVDCEIHVCEKSRLRGSDNSSKWTGHRC